MLPTVTLGKMSKSQGNRSYEKNLAAEEAGMSNQSAWEQAGIEPAIDELLSDPIAVAVMRVDGLRLENVKAALNEYKRCHEAGLFWQCIRNPAFLEQFLRMLARIGLDTEEMPLKPPTRNALYATCFGCVNREACARWLDSEMAAEGYQAFCPNAPIFDQLLAIYR